MFALFMLMSTVFSPVDFTGGNPEVLSRMRQVKWLPPVGMEGYPNPNPNPKDTHKKTLLNAVENVFGNWLKMLRVCVNINPRQTHANSAQVNLQVAKEQGLKQQLQLCEMRIMAARTNITGHVTLKYDSNLLCLCVFSPFRRNL